jgi:hypothetical protein
MFVEEGFRIRFANGEVIDFYADSTAQKEGWMKVLSETVGKDTSSGRGWAGMVLDKERKEKMRSQPAPQASKALRETSQANGQQQRPRSHEGVGSQSVPSSPVKSSHHSRTKSHVPGMPPPPIEKDARHKPSTAPRQKDATGAKPNRRDQVRSMIF